MPADDILQGNQLCYKIKEAIPLFLWQLPPLPCFVYLLLSVYDISFRPPLLTFTGPKWNCLAT